MKAAATRPSSPCSARQLRAMYERLIAEYGPQQWWPAATPFEVVVGAYLTQNTSWRGVERSILNLSAREALSVKGIRELSEEELRLLIRPSGYMVRKAAALKAFVALLDRDYRGSLDDLAAEPAGTAREKLLALPGVGPETADAILLYALGHPVMVVDEYLRRVVTRHGFLAENAKYAEIQGFAVGALKGYEPDSLLQQCNEFHALMVMVGKHYCGPKPKCETCPLAAFLPKLLGSSMQKADQCRNP